MANSGRPISITHLVLDGSSQWVIGRNVTRNCDLIHDGCHEIRLPITSGSWEALPQIDYNNHSHLPLSCFPKITKALRTIASHTASLSSCSPSIISTHSWPEKVRIINKVHKHVCGHASYGDIKTLLQRNKLWDNDIQRYLAQLIEKCQHCRAASLPKPARKVTLATLNRSFYDVDCIDHFYLDKLRCFHVMDLYSRFSAACTVPDATLSSAILAFESTWMAQFWSPHAVRGDQAFNHDEFHKYLSNGDISFQPILSRNHQNNALEPQHGVIRSIFLRLKSAHPEENSALLAVLAVTISNDLYGSDIASAFELAKGFSKPN